MLVGEGRNLVVWLNPKLQAQPVELLRQRWSPDGRSEYLIRWALQMEGEGAGSNRTTSQTKCPNILIWMLAEEVHTNCPTLLGKQQPEGPNTTKEKTSPDTRALQEMTQDVRMLVQRATRQMSQNSNPESSILNTIHVLSAYAGIGYLAKVFKETGALDLLMKMLCHSATQIRKNACKMLRALASHDAGSRAHVLLSLSKQDGIEKHMDFESRYSLLQLFAETTSSEEHCISFDGIHLPQIPGKQLFSLVKRYLCVTSLLDLLSNDRPDGGKISQLNNDWPDGGKISQLSEDRPDDGDMTQLNDDRSDGGEVTQLNDDRSDGGEVTQISYDQLDGGGVTQLERQFDFGMTMGSLICELVRVMGWVPEASPRGWKVKGTQASFYRKVFPPCLRVLHRKHKYKVRSEFSRRSDYMKYLKGVLLPGMAVRMLEDYKPLKAGDEGVFLQSIIGHPPLQVLWHRLGVTLPVHWSMLEITRELSDGGSITQDEWWEILFFIYQMDDEAQKRVMEILGGSLEKGRLPLILIPVSVDAAQEILAFIVKNCHGHLLNDLQTSHVYHQFYGKTQNTACVGDITLPTDLTPSISQVGAGQGADVRSSDLQTLNTLLLLEGLELSEKGEEKTEGMSSDHDTEIKRSLESCRVLAPGVRHVGLEHDWKSADRNLIQEEAQGASRNSAISEKMVGMLVDLLTSQVKDKLLVVTCLQLTYLVMSKYDWHVLFATVGGVRAVLGCMQEHHSSAAVQHIGLAVLKVLTGVDSADPQEPSRHNTLNPGDSQVIKEIFFSIGSAASDSSSSLLRAIPGAISKMISLEGCFFSAYNGLLVIRMLMENHEGLSRQLSAMDVTSILRKFSEEAGSSMAEPQRRLLSHLLQITESASGLTVQEMDLPSLLSGLQDIRMCREILPPLEQCVCDDVSSLRCDVPQLLTDSNFFMRLLSCLEQLRSEKHLQLCVYRILHKAVHLYEEDAIPWHKSISPSLRILEASGGNRELFQEVVRFLYRLAVVSKDCALLMCVLGAGDILRKANADHWTQKLRDVLIGCDTFTTVHHKMAACVVAGCVQTVLSQIDEHRLRAHKLTIPLLDVFLRGLAGAHTEEAGRCWEKMEVSSNPHRSSRLTDGNPKSYWESRGSTGSHSITIYMNQGVLIGQLVMVVSSEDSSYMPARVVVMGGESAAAISTELNTVTIASTAGRVLLLEDVSRFWPVIHIKIKRCHQGGTDTRVRGLEILGRIPTFWPMFEEQLCRRTFLFYNNRAHSWGQEFRDKKENLPQLYSRLSRALSHEQEFADRFLPNEESAQALGRTCWEALISPLVQSITTSDPEGVSPLGWLLTRYLENSQGSWWPKSRAFNSRVRRLTHLLVHVDTNTLDITILKPPSKTGGKAQSSSSVPGSASSCGIGSMAGMAQCWQRVVQKQVQHFLEVSWNDVDLVPRFCSMYMDLRRAMEEMFGQQTRFVVALQQGLSQGLLQLPFLTALHVTERCARYIHGQIIAIHSDSSDVQSLEELQQFLEFVPFLSDPQLSPNFQDCYRHYLADRLLTLGHGWLEDLVVSHIGICFPNKFPQQMLQNLKEGKELQRQERLHRLGKGDNEEGVALEDGGGKEDTVDVEVCVLSSQCWPFSSRCFMDEPQKYFSPAVCHHLLSFTKFFRKCPTFPSSSPIGQSQQLQWTWLGNAEVQYGRLTLQVSTLQMFILLQFNQQEAISKEDIVSRTGVSDGLLRNSLEPLTAERGILVLRENTGCFHVDTSALCDQAGAVLTLSPSHSNGAPDISMLVEKRRLIVEAIDRIIKEERQIHINALVAKAIGASWKWKDVPHGCSAMDVLSCIMCRIREGAIYRKANSPLILGCKEESPPSPPPLITLLSHDEPLTPIPPQVSEFCSVRKITNNIGSVPEERPMFRTFRYPE